MPLLFSKASKRIFYSSSILGVSVLVLGLFYNSQQRQTPLNLPNTLVWTKKGIHPNIIKIAQIKDPTSILPASYDIVGWNEYLQKHFLRPSGTDHQDMAIQQHHPRHDELTLLFRELGLIDAVYPQIHCPDLIVVFGGTPRHTYNRFQYLDDNIKEGRLYLPKHKNVLYINGRRKIVPSELEEAAALGVKCTYQHECAQAIWDKFFSRHGMLDILTIDPPAGRRANTDDTLSALYTSDFLKQRSNARLLFLSNQPYVPYQKLTAETVASRVKSTVHSETIGAADNDTPDQVKFDTIARILYTYISSISNLETQHTTRPAASAQTKSNPSHSY